MDEMLYESLDNYFRTLCSTGYVSFREVQNLILLLFYRDLMYGSASTDFSTEEWSEIEDAMHCLFDNSCLIPFDKYSAGGYKEHSGALDIIDMAGMSSILSDLSDRLKVLEDTKVVKVVPNGANAEIDGLLFISG